MSAASAPGKYSYLENMAPLLVQVELTEACNLACKFCYNSQEPRYNQKAIAILESLARQGVMQVTLTGGEPLCHPEFFAILHRACELFPNVMILSNGSLMDHDTAARIHECDILSVSISIHGNQATHDFLTGVPGSYERSIQALRFFVRRGAIPVASNFVLSSANLPLLASTITDLGAIGLSFMTITRFIPVGVGRCAAALRLSRRQLVQAFQTVHEHLERRLAPHIEIAEATPFCVLPTSLRYLANTCSYGYDRFYVDVEGNLMVCGLSRISLGGNVLDATIQEIRATSQVQRLFLADSHVPGECTVCSDFTECHGGCRAATSLDGGWMGGRDCHMKRTRECSGGESR